MVDLSAINSLDRVTNLFTANNGANNKVSFAKIHRALFNPDGTPAKLAVPHHNSGSAFGFGFADASKAGASTNI